MWLDVMAAPNPVHTGFADSLRRCHSAAAPMRAPFRFGLQRGVDDSLDSGGIVTGLPTPAWSNLPKGLGPATAKALAPESNRFRIHTVLTGDRHLRLARSDGQDNTAT